MSVITILQGRPEGHKTDSQAQSSLAALHEDTALHVALLLSVVLHMAVIVASALGLPYLKKPLPVSAQPIPVEIIADLSQTDKPRPPEKSASARQDSKRTDPGKKPKELERPPAPPKVTAKTQPKTTAPKPPDLKPVEETEPLPAVPMPGAEIPKEPPKKPERKKPEKVSVVKNEEAFLSVLKNLQDSETSAASDPARASDRSKPEDISPLARFSQRITTSELGALREQLGDCWSLAAGARYAEDLVVEVRMMINPDRTVRQATIVDKGRYARDPYFRAAADSAIRAVNSPLCNPLDLPPNKYDIWKEIIVNFDPREML